MRQILESDIQQSLLLPERVIRGRPLAYQDVTVNGRRLRIPIILLLVIVVRVGAAQLEWRRMPKHQLDA